MPSSELARPCVVAITQPNFTPWLGYLEMIDRADLFVFLDDVQYPTTRKEWVNRNRVRSSAAAGWDWITVAIRHEGRREKLICETRIANAGLWLTSLEKRIRAAYAQHPFFARYSPEYLEILAGEYTSLADLNITLVQWAMRCFGIDTRTVRSSKLRAQGVKDERLLGIVQEVGGNHYLANNGSQPYIRPQFFRDNGVQFSFQDYRVPPYRQYDPDALPPLCFLDLLLTEGPDAGLGIIRSGRPADWQLRLHGGVRS